MKASRSASLLLAAFLHVAPFVARTLPALPSLASSPAGILFKWMLGALVLGGGMHTVSAATATLVSASTISGKTGTRLSYQVRISDGKNRLPESWFIGGKTFSNSGSTTVGFPTGLSLALSTAIISGIPTAAGSYAVPIIAYEHPNRTGAKLSFTLTFNIAGSTSPPGITTDPIGGTVTEGDPFTFTVAATGDGPLSYQWFRDSVALPTGTEATLVFNAVTLADAGSYTVTVSNSAGSVTSTPAQLVVNSALVAPTISNQSASLALHTGEPLSLSVTASGTEPLTYRWTRNGQSFAGAADSPRLDLTEVNSDTAGTYTVEVSGPGGTVTSAPIVVSVVELKIGSMTVDGNTLRFSVPTIPGRHYALEAASALPTTAWNLALEFTATGDTTELTQVISSNSGLFWRYLARP